MTRVKPRFKSRLIHVYGNMSRKTSTNRDKIEFLLVSLRKGEMEP